MGVVWMTYRRLDADGDMLPARGNPPFEGAEAVGAAVRSRILLFYGEWWEAPEDGLDISYMFGYQNDEKQRGADALLRQRIAETEGVSDILELTFGDIATNRRRTVTAVIETDTGETITVEV